MARSASSAVPAVVMSPPMMSRSTGPISLIACGTASKRSWTFDEVGDAHAI
jgi:hypothetical protein